MMVDSIYFPVEGVSQWRRILLCDGEMPTVVSKWQLLNVVAFFYAWVPKKSKMQPSTPSIWCVSCWVFFLHSMAITHAMGRNGPCVWQRVEKKNPKRMCGPFPSVVVFSKIRAYCWQSNRPPKSIRRRFFFKVATCALSKIIVLAFSPKNTI